MRINLGNNKLILAAMLSLGIGAGTLTSVQADEAGLMGTSLSGGIHSTLDDMVTQAESESDLSRVNLLNATNYIPAKDIAPIPQTQELTAFQDTSTLTISANGLNPITDTTSFIADNSLPGVLISANINSPVQSSHLSQKSSSSASTGDSIETPVPALDGISDSLNSAEEYADGKEITSKPKSLAVNQSGGGASL